MKCILRYAGCLTTRRFKDSVVRNVLTNLSAIYRILKTNITTWRFIAYSDEVYLKITLELLKKDKLFAKFSKCEFWLKEVHFLRHVVNRNDIHVDSSKIEVMKNWKVPKMPSEIRSFLGLTGYYQRFITNFFKVAKPLTSLTKKNQKYEWSKEQEESFQTLNDNLCNAPILSLSEGSKDFVVYCDVSNQGLSCVLMQRGKVIAYAS
ncbi:putative reverse transcriptase domain-containing protein [Tanacetum coccineum]